MKIFILSMTFVCLILTVGPVNGDVANVQPITVDSGPTSDYVNGVFTSVTVCIPGNDSDCQTISGVLVDTGSVGLRILSSALSLSLPQQTGTSGNPVVECLPFFSGYTWGPVRLADVMIAGEQASSVPIQVVGDPSFSVVPTSCSNYGSPMDTLQTLGANGILGVGLFQQDCGAACTVSGSSNPGLYYECSSSSCLQTVESLSQQVQNPVGLFASDNNGVIIELPSVPPTGASSINGSLIFGIGTQSNNTLGTSTVLTTDSSGEITTIYQGQPCPSFLDSGSNGIFFLDSAITGIPTCPSPSQDWYCPSSIQNLSSTTAGANGATANVNFSVANADSLFANPSLSVFSNLAGPFLPAFFDWGLPFFFGRTVFTAIELQETPAGPGPYYAYYSTPAVTCAFKDYVFLDVSALTTGEVVFRRDSCDYNTLRLTNTITKITHSAPPSGDYIGAHGSSAIVTYGATVPVLKYLPPQVGQTWSGTGVVTFSAVPPPTVYVDYPVNANSEVTSLSESVTLPIGTFENCAKVVETLEYPLGIPQGADIPIRFERWFAPGLGPVAFLVQESSSTIHTGVLTSYSNITAAQYDYFPLEPNSQWTFTMEWGDVESWTVTATEATPLCLIGAAFADYGTYYYENGTWIQVTPVSASWLAHGDFDGDGSDDMAGVFKGYGTYTYVKGLWTQLTPVEADFIATGDFSGDGYDDIVAGFSGYGTYTYINNVWTQLTPVKADFIATGDFNGDGNDDIVAAFSGYGTYTYINGTWSQLTPVEATQIATGDFNADGNDDIVASFPGYGTYTYVNGTWSQITPVQADLVGVGDFDNDGKDDIVAAFAGYGTYTYIDGVWTQLTSVEADLIEIGDFNNDGKAEIVAAFTGYGIYEYMNNSWNYLVGVMPTVFYGCQMQGLPDTGITKCYNNTQEISCPSPGQPFYGQDAQYTTNPMSFTDNGNGTVTDNVTRLIWQKQDDDTLRNWADAGAYCDSLTLAGYTDWRLPNEYELQGIVRYDLFNPAIDATYFPGTKELYW